MSLLTTATPTTSAHFSAPLLPSSHAHRRCVAAPLGRIRRPRLVPVVASVPDPAAGPMEYTPWLIAGLGNPGNKYYGTRHNVGFEMVDRIALEEGITMNTIQSKSLLGVGSIGEVPVLLVKPQSYMNYSGEAIGPLAAYYQVPLRHILLVYDDMSLPNGVLRIQRKGGHGRHNGLQNVIEQLDGRREFPRLSIGIGSPPGKMDTRAFLLQKFSSEERVQIDTALEQGVDAVRTLVLKGFSGSIERFNLVQKYKFHRV
ncbi:chloroplastic group IIB intron splicing facilitator CRS2, chloroplastic-like isoform X2 [Panicum virgatum]|uniref:chloroplastic group IIB intron splicing facilitator CRS2, chloroplastic-like isoform X2 n=1 Tax=Panicum virgatum TaxID=38727 RepID=UPI0019D508FC|nr:chloroplastic group IIB intron splicing facilitator CRS2, chloroplastic-like isoform X2 [Panicum virgatum]